MVSFGWLGFFFEVLSCMNSNP